MTEGEEVNGIEKELKEELAGLKNSIEDIRKEIIWAVSPKFLELSAAASDLVELAIDYWRMENKINKIVEQLNKEQREGVANSIHRIKRYLDKNDIEIIDHTNQKYDENENLEILTVEKNPKIKEPKIIETKEPTILYKGHVIHIGKVIVEADVEEDDDE